MERGWVSMSVPNPNFERTTIKTPYSNRRGRSCITPTIASSASQRIKTIRFASLPYKGPRLFNSLPPDIRNVTNCELSIFKGALDIFLAKLLDQPLIPTMTQFKLCDSNSVIDWVKQRHHSPKPPLRPLAGPKDSHTMTAC